MTVVPGVALTVSLRCNQVVVDPWGPLVLNVGGGENKVADRLQEFTPPRL